MCLPLPGAQHLDCVNLKLTHLSLGGTQQHQYDIMQHQSFSWETPLLRSAYSHLVGGTSMAAWLC